MYDKKKVVLSKNVFEILLAISSESISISCFNEVDNRVSFLGLSLEFRHSSGWTGNIVENTTKIAFIK